MYTGVGSWEGDAYSWDYVDDGAAAVDTLDHLVPQAASLSAHHCSPSHHTHEGTYTILHVVWPCMLVQYHVTYHMIHCSMVEYFPRVTLAFFWFSSSSTPCLSSPFASLSGYNIIIHYYSCPLKRILIFIVHSVWFDSSRLAVVAAFLAWIINFIPFYFIQIQLDSLPL